MYGSVKQYAIRYIVTRGCLLLLCSIHLVNVILYLTIQNLETGASYEKTYTSDEMVEQVEVDKTKAAFSWTDGETLFFMTNDTFEELPVPVNLVDNYLFLKEGEEFRVMRCQDKILGVEMPTIMQYKVRRRGQ